jgi:hypothetical protein
MPTPTPEMDEWIYSIYGKHPSDFAKPSIEPASPPSKGVTAEAWDWDWAKDTATAAGEAIGKFDSSHGRVLTRAAGAAQMVGGVADAAVGAVVAGVGVGTTATGVGAVVGVPEMIGGTALVLNGADNAMAGWKTLLTGEPHDTSISQAAGAGLQKLGASDATVKRVTEGVNFLQQATAGFGSMTMLPKGASEAAAAERTSVTLRDARETDQLAGKAGEAPRPPVALSGRDLELSHALRDAPIGSPERAKLVEEFATRSTHPDNPVNQVVFLGKWEEEGNGGYIDYAKAGGGIWYQTPKGSFDVIGEEAAWETNVAFLLKQLASGIPTIKFANLNVAEALAAQAEKDADAATHGMAVVVPPRVKEIRFLLENAPKYGYKLVGNEFLKIR